MEDLQNMSPEQLRLAQQEFNIGINRTTAQQNYDNQLKEVARITAEKERVEGKIKRGARRETRELEAALVVLGKYAKELKKVDDQVKKAGEIEALNKIKASDVATQEKYYTDKLNKLKAQASVLEDYLLDENKKPIKDIFSISSSEKTLNALNAQISDTKRILNSFRETEISGDKDFWELKLETALKVQSEIDDIQLRKLKGASPEQLSSGNVEGVLPETVKSFVDSEADIALATQRLKIFERAKEESDTRIENNKSKLLEQRNKNALAAEIILQGKILKTEEESTQKKLDLAANEYQLTLAT